jgi:hypothetical protein
MKLSEEVKTYVDARIKDEKNQAQMYQILIDGYWAGELDMDPSKGEITRVTNPVPRVATPGTAHISGAIMQAIVGGKKK